MLVKFTKETDPNSTKEKRNKRFVAAASFSCASD
jgi:hypothetical protein